MYLNCGVLGNTFFKKWNKLGNQINVFLWLTQEQPGRSFGKICALCIKEMHWFGSLSFYLFLIYWRRKKLYLNLSKIKLWVQYENNVWKCALMTCVLSGHLCIFVRSECPAIPSVEPGEWCWIFRRSRGRKRPREYSLTKNEELKYHQPHCLLFFPPEHSLQNVSQTTKPEGTALPRTTVTSDTNCKFGLLKIAL